MSNSLYKVTKTIHSCSVNDDNLRRTFPEDDVILVSDEAAQAHGQPIVKFRQASPPGEGVPWEWYYVTKAVFDESVERVPPVTGPTHIRRRKTT
jgi:hypothetical protein